MPTRVSRTRDRLPRICACCHLTLASSKLYQATTEDSCAYARHAKMSWRIFKVQAETPIPSAACRCTCQWPSLAVDAEPVDIMMLPCSQLDVVHERKPHRNNTSALLILASDHVTKRPVLLPMLLLTRRSAVRRQSAPVASPCVFDDTADHAWATGRHRCDDTVKKQMYNARIVTRTCDRSVCTELSRAVCVHRLHFLVQASPRWQQALQYRQEASERDMHVIERGVLAWIPL